MEIVEADAEDEDEDESVHARARAHLLMVSSSTVPKGPLRGPNADHPDEDDDDGANEIVGAGHGGGVRTNRSLLWRLS